MDSLEIPVGSAAPALTPIIGTQRPPRIWKFWGTALWGLFIFAAMFVGQIGVVAWFILRRGGPIDVAAAVHGVGGGLTISLSVIMGLPAVLAALWIACFAGPILTARFRVPIVPLAEQYSLVPDAYPRLQYAVETVHPGLIFADDGGAYGAAPPLVRGRSQRLVRAFIKLAASK